jgi:hypothetical protein
MPNDFTYVVLDRRIRAIVIHDVELYGEGRLIKRWFRQLGRDFEKAAKSQAPVNKRPKDPKKDPAGALKRSIRVNTRRVGTRQLQNTLTIGVRYASFVVRGTGPYIQAHNPKGMRIYWMQLKGVKGPTDGEYVWRSMVRGQRRNAFLDRAARITSAKHPSIRGLHRKKIGV